MSDKPDIVNELNELNEEVPLLKPVKVKKPRTQKQLEAFTVVQEKLKAKRDEQLEMKKVEAAKLLLKHESKTKKKTNVTESESSSEEEIIYLKRDKPKKKKKVKTIILSSSESESETESDDNVEPIKEKKFISQQSKKSIIKVSKPEPIKRNYFVD